MRVDRRAMNQKVIPILPNFLGSFWRTLIVERMEILSNSLPLPERLPVEQESQPGDNVTGELQWVCTAFLQYFQQFLVLIDTFEEPEQLTGITHATCITATVLKRPLNLRAISLSPFCSAWYLRNRQAY